MTDPKPSKLDDDPTHREGFKVVLLDLTTKKYYTQPDGPQSRTDWTIDQVTHLPNQSAGWPLKMCKYALHFSVEKAHACYWFVPFADINGIRATGQNGWVPSLHSVKVPSGPILMSRPKKITHLGDRLKRGARRLKFGPPLTGSFFSFDPFEEVSVHNGLLHSYPISDEQITFLSDDDREFLSRPSERGQWYLPSIEMECDTSFRWHRDGHPVMSMFKVSCTTDDLYGGVNIRNWPRMFRQVHLAPNTGHHSLIVLLNRETFEKWHPIGRGRFHVVRSHLVDL